jgi:hypothetical protein
MCIHDRLSASTPRILGNFWTRSVADRFNPLIYLASPTGDAGQVSKSAVFLEFCVAFRPGLYHGAVPTCNGAEGRG